MKSITTKVISLAALTLSMNVGAASAIDALSVESIKATLTPEQIQHALDQWKIEALADIDKRAQSLSDRMPLEARRTLAEAHIEQEYQLTANALNL